MIPKAVAAPQRIVLRREIGVGDASHNFFIGQCFCFKNQSVSKPRFEVIMLKAITLLTLVCLSGFAEADELRVSSKEPVVVDASNQWKSERDAPPSDAFPFETYRVVPTGERNVILLVSIMGRDRREFSDPGFLKTLLKGDCGPYVGSAAEPPKFEVKELKIDGGRGYYANFVDPDLVGKPVKKGSHKVATPIILSLTSKYLIKLTLLCDDLNGADYRDAFKIVESIRIKKE